jgi:hypothetical protein
MMDNERSKAHMLVVFRGYQIRGYPPLTYKWMTLKTERRLTLFIKVYVACTIPLQRHCVMNNMVCLIFVHIFTFFKLFTCGYCCDA